MANVLNNHVDVDIRIGDRTQNLVGDTGFVGFEKLNFVYILIFNLTHNTA